MSRRPKSRALRSRTRGPLRQARSKHWDRHPEDWYVEEEWCGRRFFEVEPFVGRIWDPWCGIGRLVTAARAAGHDAFGSDLRDRGFPGVRVKDFFRCLSDLVQPNIVGNPPFTFIDACVAHALNLCTRKLSLVVPSSWPQANDRSIWLERTPLRRVYLLTPRPSMPPGPVILAGEKPGNGTTDYSIAVWEHGYTGRPEYITLRRDDPPPARTAET